MEVDNPSFTNASTIKETMQKGKLWYLEKFTGTLDFPARKTSEAIRDTVFSPDPIVHTNEWGA